MVTKEQLIQDFGKARENGWNVTPDKFPPNGIAEPFWPEKMHLFRALEKISPSEVKYLILGKDPYTNHGNSADATGIAFAVDINRTGPLPPSLVRILMSVYGCDNVDIDLKDWTAEYKILLLNAAFTVPRLNPGQTGRDVAGDHLQAWHSFTKGLLVYLKTVNPNAKLIGFGNEARNVICDALEELDYFASCYHPSFFGGGEKNFDDFWSSPKVGFNLRMPPLSK